MLKQTFALLWCVTTSCMIDVPEAVVDTSPAAVQAIHDQINPLIARHKTVEDAYVAQRAKLIQAVHGVRNKIEQAGNMSPEGVHATIKNIVLHDSSLGGQTGDHVAVMKAASQTMFSPGSDLSVQRQALLEYYRNDPTLQEHAAQMQKLFDEKNIAQQEIEAQLKPLLDKRLRQLEARSSWQKFTAFMYDVFTSGIAKLKSSAHQNLENVTQTTTTLKQLRGRVHNPTQNGPQYQPAEVLHALHGSGYVLPASGGTVMVSRDAASIKAQLIATIQQELQKGNRANTSKIIDAMRELDLYNQFLQNDAPALSQQLLEKQQ